jgi:Glucose / Sorbosone dehydrogenase
VRKWVTDHPGTITERRIKVQDLIGGADRGELRQIEGSLRSSRGASQAVHAIDAPNMARHREQESSVAIGREVREILAVLVGVVGGASIPMRDVEEAVRPEDVGPPVVVPVRLLEPEDFDFGRRVGPIGIVLADLEPGHDLRQPFRLRCVENEKIPVLLDDIPSGREQVGGGGHGTRDLEFSADGKALFVAVGSRSNVSDDASEKRRANILAFDPDGKNERVFAWGIRNPVGLAKHPETGQLWISVNERDLLGDHLVPDYITHVEEWGFYGWPWYYLGPNPDPRHLGKHPELKDKVIVPDVLVQSHSASLDLTFYDGEQFPREYRNEIFAAEHGSWNRARRTGYKVIRVPMKGVKHSADVPR